MDNLSTKDGCVQCGKIADEKGYMGYKKGPVCFPCNDVNNENTKAEFKKKNPGTESFEETDCIKCPHCGFECKDFTGDDLQSSLFDCPECETEIKIEIVEYKVLIKTSK